MSGDAGIHIHRAIAHKVDHHSFDEPQLSDLEIPLSDPVRAYLRRHIQASREHRNSRTAVFVPDPSEETFSLRTLCDTVLGKPDAFVAESQKIARHLFNHLSGRTSPGDLVVCVFSEGDGDADPCLAILKMDPSDAFAAERLQSDGKWQMVLRLVPEVLPTGQDELQKCAFILPQALRTARGYDLKVLDQQNRRYGIREAVATFFSEGFLQCKIALNPAEMTMQFVVKTQRWLKRRTLEWSNEDRTRAQTQIYQRIQQEQVDVTDYARSVIAEPEQQEAYLGYLRQQGVEDLTFEPDAQQRQRLTEYAVFEGDEGLQIRIRAEAVSRMITCAQDQASGERVITIRTTSWRQTRGESNPCS